MFSFFEGLFSTKSSARSAQMLKAFNAATAPDESDTNPLTRIWENAGGGQVSLRLAQESHHTRISNMLFIDRIVAYTPGQGDGTAALEMLSNLADQHKMDLGLHIAPTDHATLNVNQLEKWAGKHGFDRYEQPDFTPRATQLLLFWREPVSQTKRPAPVPA